MNKMVAIAGVALLGGVVAPYITGGMARDEIKQRIDMVNDAKMGVVIGYSEVSASVYSSVVNLSFSLDTAQLTQQDLTPEQIMAINAVASGDFNLELQHGPWVFNDHANIALAGWDINRSWPLPTGDEISFAYTGALGMNNATTGKLTLSELETEIAPQVSLNFSGLEMDFNCSSTECYMKSDMPYMFFHGGPEQRMSVTNFKIEGTSDNDMDIVLAGGLYDADISIDVESIDANGEFLMSGFGVDVKTSLDTDTDIGAAEVTYRADRVITNGMTVDAVNATVELGNVINSSLVQVQKLLRDNPEPGPEMLSDFAVVLAPMLNEGININLKDLGFKIDGNAFLANAEFVAQSDEVNEMIMANPMYWNSIVTGDADVVIDVELAKTIAKMQVTPQLAMMGVDPNSPDGIAQLNAAADARVKEMTNMGFFDLEGDQLVMKVQKTAEALKLNGLPIPM